jgi:hypothetical protein
VSIPDGLRRACSASPDAEKVVIVTLAKRASQEKLSVLGSADAKELIEGVYAGEMRGASVPAARMRDDVLEVIEDTEESVH